MYGWDFAREFQRISMCLEEVIGEIFDVYDTVKGARFDPLEF